MLRVTVLVGNPNPGSRTRAVAEAVVRQLLVDDSYELSVIELAEHSSRLFEWGAEDVAALNNEVAASDLVIVASPTYKASYTGLLKAFLDRYPTNGLSGVIAIPVMTGGDLTHSLGVDVNLRPLLVELGASVPTRGLYFVADQIEELEPLIADWVASNAGPLRAIAALATSLR